MTKSRFLTTVIILINILFLLAYSSKEGKKEYPDIKDSIKTEYILKEYLSLNDYSSSKGYFPKEGFTPTAEIAVQIAEPILNEIYWTEMVLLIRDILINTKEIVKIALI